MVLFRLSLVSFTWLSSCRQTVKGHSWLIKSITSTCNMSGWRETAGNLCHCHLWVGELRMCKQLLLKVCQANFANAYMRMFAFIGVYTSVHKFQGPYLLFTLSSHVLLLKTKSQIY